MVHGHQDRDASGDRGDVRGGRRQKRPDRSTLIHYRKNDGIQAPAQEAPASSTPRSKITGHRRTGDRLEGVGGSRDGTQVNGRVVRLRTAGDKNAQTAWREAASRTAGQRGRDHSVRSAAPTSTPPLASLPPYRPGPPPRATWDDDTLFCAGRGEGQVRSLPMVAARVNIVPPQPQAREVIGLTGANDEHVYGGPRDYRPAVDVSMGTAGVRRGTNAEVRGWPGRRLVGQLMAESPRPRLAPGAGELARLVD